MINTILPLEELQRRFNALLPKLPVIAGAEVVNFALDNFKLQGFIGEQPWRPRKDPTKWGTSPKNNGRAILIGDGSKGPAGRLKRDIRVLRSNADEVVIGSTIPYAKVQNDGLRLGIIQTVKPFTRKTKKGNQSVSGFTRKIDQNIPARPFLKESPYLTARVSRIIATEILKTLR